MSKGAPVCTKIPLNGGWGLDIVASTLERRVEAGQEVIQMGCNDSHTLLHRSSKTAHDQRQQEHSPWKQFDRDLKDDEMCLLATVVLGVSVHECQHKWRGENIAIEEHSGGQLRFRLVEVVN